LPELVSAHISNFALTNYYRNCFLSPVKVTEAASEGIAASKAVNVIVLVGAEKTLTDAHGSEAYEAVHPFEQPQRLQR
jgi:hypothetical protein